MGRPRTGEGGGGGSRLPSQHICSFAHSFSVCQVLGAGGSAGPRPHLRKLVIWEGCQSPVAGGDEYCEARQSRGRNCGVTGCSLGRGSEKASCSGGTFEQATERVRWKPRGHLGQVHSRKRAQQMRSPEAVTCLAWRHWGQSTVIQAGGREQTGSGRDM